LFSFFSQSLDECQTVELGLQLIKGEEPSLFHQEKPQFFRYTFVSRWIPARCSSEGTLEYSSSLAGADGGGQRLLSVRRAWWRQHCPAGNARHGVRQLSPRPQAGSQGGVPLPEKVNPYCAWEFVSQNVAFTRGAPVTAATLAPASPTGRPSTAFRSGRKSSPARGTLARANEQSG